MASIIPKLPSNVQKLLGIGGDSDDEKKIISKTEDLVDELNRCELMVDLYKNQISKDRKSETVEKPNEKTDFDFDDFGEDENEENENLFEYDQIPQNSPKLFISDENVEMQISKEKVEKALESVRKSLFGLSKFSDKFPSLDKTKNLQKRFAKILNSLNDEKTIKSDLISPIKNGSDIKNFELKTDNGQNVKAFLREVFDIEDEIDVKNDHFVKNDKTDFDKELEKSEVEYNGENVKKKEKVSEIDVNKIFGPPKEKTSVIKKRSFKDDFVEKKRSEISEDLNDMAVTLKDTAVNFGQTILGDLTKLESIDNMFSENKDKVGNMTKELQKEQRIGGYAESIFSYAILVIVFVLTYFVIKTFPTEKKLNFT